MPKVAKPLSALEVSRLREPGFHAVGGVPGLHLRIRPPSVRYWVLRVKVGGKRRDIGLGPFSEAGLTLARAREAALGERARIKAGTDPVADRRAARSAIVATQAKEMTFQQCATAYIAAHEAGWRNTKHAQQWRNSLEQHAHPVIGSMLVRDIELTHVLKVLEPIWTDRTETASRVRGRIEKVLDWAKGRGLRHGDNPAAWKGNLSAQLPNPSKVAKVEHFPALPIDDIGRFMAALSNAEGMGARALEFAILTAARSGEVRGATWGEIDLKARVWTIPAARMKAGNEHRVPLSDAAVRLLQALPRMAGTDIVFPSTKGSTLSDMTLTAALRRLHAAAVDRGEAGFTDPKSEGRIATPHGMRSTFRDWAAERTAYPHGVVEAALAHTVADETAAAYLRSDLFDRRRRLMDDWAAFVARIEHPGEVVPIRGAA